MINPWLKIPASDYESHMALPEVAQAKAIKKAFAAALARYTPTSLAVFGCTTGNGFSHIDTSKTRRVIGIDINPEYLNILEKRFGPKIPNMQLIEADITRPDFRIEPVSMIFAGLVFEYVNPCDALSCISKCMQPDAILVSILQLPSEASSPVTATRYESLELLSPLMRLVNPLEFKNACSTMGLGELETKTIPLQKGKAFHLAYYKKDRRLSAKLI